jgi:hypothetical protein
MPPMIPPREMPPRLVMIAARETQPRSAKTCAGRATSGTTSATDVIDGLGATQLGLVTRAQLLDAGITRETIAARVRARRLRLVHRGVYQVGPVALPRSRELAAVLACGPGSVLSYVTAGAL